MVTMIIMSFRNCLNRTVLFVHLAWLLKYKRFFERDAFLAVDEIESSLHPKLIEYIIERFLKRIRTGTVVAHYAL